MAGVSVTSTDRGTSASSSGRIEAVITSEDQDVRNTSLHSICTTASLGELLEFQSELRQLLGRTSNLYHRVRALLFLSAIHRYYIPKHVQTGRPGRIPFQSYEHILDRRFTQGIDALLAYQRNDGPSDAISSALAHAYYQLAFQTLADQVRKSVRTIRGNQWMFRTGHPADHPLKVADLLLRRDERTSMYPVLVEKTPVRMDFSHSAWSDIFFLGMDYPSGARVINASINLATDGSPGPPIECYFRVIDEPVLRLTSVDLQATADLSSIDDVFDFACDHLGLLKAAIIASGIVPPGMEGCELGMASLLDRLVGPGKGIELTSKVNGIPKGSRLAVSTNLLGSLISICMRATSQVEQMQGGQAEVDRRLIAARAILGEWLGGSGGGWQDSGGLWPGIKLIEGTLAQPGDPEYRVSRGCLLPRHKLLGEDAISQETRTALQDSLVLVHGGMAQNCGPILEMVTEKYLLRSSEAWRARQHAMTGLDQILDALRSGDIRTVGRLTHANFFGPLQKIIPWCTNLFTESLVRRTEQKYRDRFWGFWMLGGMSGGGMGFIFDPSVKSAAQAWLGQTMVEMKRSLETKLPFAMDPVVYNFEFNHQGTWAEVRTGGAARMPDEYYAMMIPRWLKRPSRDLAPSTRRELERLGTDYRRDDQDDGRRRLIENLLPDSAPQRDSADGLDDCLRRYGFDVEAHERVRSDLRAGRIGLAQNRLGPTTDIRDVEQGDVTDARGGLSDHLDDVGRDALRDGKLAVVTLAAGVGSRWTEGAGIVKGLHPFCQFAGRHRTFVETHLAKSRLVGDQVGRHPPHIITTGHLTQGPIQRDLDHVSNFGYPGLVLLSSGRHVGLRMVPMVRDLQFDWEHTVQQKLDEQQQKVRASLRSALIAWAERQGEGADYRDNEPMQCLHPVGHWYEIPNLLRNGILARLLDEQPQIEHLMLHNIDTLGANVNAALFGLHLERQDTLTFELITRRLEDRGGGLARVDGRLRLIEGLALPREEDEFKLSYYNSMTTWINIDKMLDAFSLTREMLSDRTAVDQSVSRMSRRMPTYITLKEVKKRWGHGQEDTFPVSQFEKLWSDMTALPDVKSGYVVVPLPRGQQLKQQSQLDGWLRDGGADYVDGLCRWTN